MEKIKYIYSNNNNHLNNNNNYTDKNINISSNIKIKKTYKLKGRMSNNDDNYKSSNTDNIQKSYSNQMGNDKENINIKLCSRCNDILNNFGSINNDKQLCVKCAYKELYSHIDDSNKNKVRLNDNINTKNNSNTNNTNNTNNTRINNANRINNMSKYGNSLSTLKLTNIKNSSNQNNNSNNNSINTKSLQNNNIKLSNYNYNIFPNINAKYNKNASNKNSFTIYSKNKPFKTNSLNLDKEFFSNIGNEKDAGNNNKIKTNADIIKKSKKLSEDNTNSTYNRISDNSNNSKRTSREEINYSNNYINNSLVTSNCNKETERYFNSSVSEIRESTTPRFKNNNKINQLVNYSNNNAPYDPNNYNSNINSFIKLANREKSYRDNSKNSNNSKNTRTPLSSSSDYSEHDTNNDGNNNFNNPTNQIQQYYYNNLYNNDDNQANIKDLIKQSTAINNKNSNNSINNISNMNNNSLSKRVTYTEYLKNKKYYENHLLDNYYNTLRNKNITHHSDYYLYDFHQHFKIMIKLIKEEAKHHQDPKMQNLILLKFSLVFHERFINTKTSIEDSQLNIGSDVESNLRYICKCPELYIKDNKKNEDVVKSSNFITSTTSHIDCDYNNKDYIVIRDKDKYSSKNSNNVVVDGSINNIKDNHDNDDNDYINYANDDINYASNEELENELVRINTNNINEHSNTNISELIHQSLNNQMKNEATEEEILESK